MGYDEMYICPALIYCSYYCFFSAFIAPFAGFFASGFKRAYKVKDFSDTLPGHGGFTDRMDCIIYAIYFNYFMVTQVILADQYHVDSIHDMSFMMNQDEKIELVNILAANQGLPPLWI